MAPLRVAVEGCGHGSLNDIYEAVERKAAERGWDNVDLVIIGGDFQALRNANDATGLSVPDKFKQIGDFHEYYSGSRIAPYLTIFIGGNHEASNHLFELYYGGWAARNIYYLGAVNTLRLGPLRISGMSGIWKGYDYRKPHFERLPYNKDDVSSIYHVREIDVRKLLQVRTQVDIGLSHDWPKGIEKLGDFQTLFRKKPGFKADSESGKLGNVAAREALDHLRPAHWFSAHLHVRFAAEVHHDARPAEREITKPAEAHVAVAAADASPADASPADASPVIASPVVATPVDASPAINISRSDLDSSVLGAHRVLGSATGDENSRLAAWQNFGAVARKNEMADQATFMREFRARQSSNVPRDIKFNECARIAGGPIQKFVRGADGERIENAPADNEKADNLDEIRQGKGHMAISSLDGQSESNCISNCISIDKGVEASNSVADDNSHAEMVPNTDKVDIASSPDSTSSIHATTGQGSSSIFKATKDITEDVNNADKISLATSPGSAASMNSPPAQKSLPKRDISLDWNNEKRTPDSWWTAGDDDLVGVMDKDLPTTLDQPAAPVAVMKNLPAPEGIKNCVTQFLTLDKPHNYDDFVELLEIEPISETNDSELERPFRLQYDKEWLAISRVFSDELQLGGNPTDRVPAHKGYQYYQQRIAEEEKWVEEHVVKAGLMDIPDNFVQTAPIFDPSVSINTHDQPPEYTNPQTSAFCDLIQIENKFALSEEERKRRLEVGPREEQHRPFQRNRGGGRGGRGGRGRGGRGRGRGGHRGRGAPQNTASGW